MNPTVLATENLSRSFGSTQANRDISIVIRAGEIHALLGENGAGKSTLISCLAGFTRPDSGEIKVGVAEESITLPAFESPSAALKAGVRTVFQNSSLVAEMTIDQNFAIADVDTSGFAALTERLLGAPLNLSRKVSSLDLGARHVVEITRAILAKPKVLLLDEPTALVSSESASHLMRVLEEQAADQTAVVLVTHRIDAAVSAAHAFTVLRSGSVKSSFRRDEYVGSDAGLRTLLTDSMFGEGLQLVERAAPRERSQTSVAVRAHHLFSEPVAGDCGIADVSFEIVQGEILAVAGIGGNGQDRLAELLEGTAAIERGELTLDGENITADSVRERREKGLRSLTADRFGAGTIAELSVAMNAVLKQIGRWPFWRRGLTRLNVIREFGEHQIREYSIKARSADQAAGELSGGNVQKLMLSRELDADAKFCVLREPTHGVDLRSAQYIHELIVDRASEGTAVLLLSSDLDEIVKLADRILVLENGRVVAEVPGRQADTRKRIAQEISTAQPRPEAAVEGSQHP